MAEKGETKIIITITICLILISIGFSGCIGNDSKNGCIDDGRRKSIRPSNIQCMEFDHVRNTLLIGDENGLFIYYPVNETYEVIGDDYITTIAIDNKHDIYYLGTAGEGLRKYIIETKTYEEIPTKMHDFDNYGKLTYDEYNNFLIRSQSQDPEKMKNVAYYDRGDNLLINYSYGILYIENYNINDIIKRNVSLKDYKNLEYGIVDITYDSKYNVIFFGIKYGYYNKRTEYGLISYNLNTDNFSYIRLNNKSNIGSDFVVMDICLNPNTHELYIATYDDGVFKLNISNGEIKIIRWVSVITALAFDSNNDILYISVWWEGTHIWKYYPNKGHFGVEPPLYYKPPE